MNYKKINLITLILTIILLFALKPEKHLYFDEPFQIMASSGVTAANIGIFENKPTITSTEINQANTLTRVLTGGMDSIHYIFLHFLPAAFHIDRISLFVLFSMFWGAGTLIAFYYLCKELIGNNIYTSLAIILLFTSLMFLNQSYSIRHYIMALFFITSASYFFFKYSFVEKSDRNLILLLLLADLSYLSHYFTSFIIAIFLMYLFAAERSYVAKNKKQLMIIGLNAVLFFSIFFLRNPKDSPLSAMTKSGNYAHHIVPTFSVSNSFILFFKNVAINFGVNYPLFSNNAFVAVLSALLVLALPIAFLVLKIDIPKKRQYYVLFALGMASSLFIWTLSFLSHTINLFTFRYFLFSLPFCAIFIALTIKYVFELKRSGAVVKWALTVVLVAPTLTSFAIRSFQKPVDLPCTHPYIAREIAKKNIKKVEVPAPIDAIFINCLLPANYDILYVIDSNSTTATLYGDSNIEKVPIIKNELIVTF